MTAVYFLDGLGSNRFYVTPLAKALESQGIELVYMALPGHPDNEACHVETLDGFLEWFEGLVDQDNVTLMGFSLGADLATYLAYHSSKVARLILLDGGLLDVTQAPLQQELEAASHYIDQMVVEDLEAYLQEEAAQSEAWSEDLEQAERYAFVKDGSTYRLKLDKETVLKLLSLRYEAGLVITKSDYATPTLAILAQKPESLLTQKQANLQKANKDFVSSLTLPDTSHNLYREVPDKIALATRFFLDAL